MRCGNPSIACRLEVLVTRGCGRSPVMPLCPQYSAATTAPVCHEAFASIRRQGRQAALRLLPAYYADSSKLQVSAASLHAGLKSLAFTPDVILASYHGMQNEAVAKGDPYEAQCTRTTALLRAQLGLDEERLMMSFQSRFGRAQWIEPYTINTVR